MTDVVVVSVQPASTVLVDLGVPGPRGRQGPVLPPFEHIQSIPAAVWTIVHNRGYFPAGVTLLDSAKRSFHASVSYPDVNTVIVSMTGAQSGTAYVS